MRTDDFLTGFLMALAISWVVGYLAGLLSGWFGHHWSASRALPVTPHPRSVAAKVLEPGYGAPSMAELQRIEDTIARALSEEDTTPLYMRQFDDAIRHALNSSSPWHRTDDDRLIG